MKHLKIHILMSSGQAKSSENPFGSAASLVIEMEEMCTPHMTQCSSSILILALKPHLKLYNKIEFLLVFCSQESRI